MPGFEIYNSIQIAYLKGQAALLPLYLILFSLSARIFKLEHRIRLRNLIALASIFIPAVLLALPMIPQQVSAIPVTDMTVAINSTVSYVLKQPVPNHVYQFSSLITIVSIAIFLGLFIRQFFQEKKLSLGADRVVARGRVRLIFSQKVASPFSTGLFFIRIYFPRRLLSAKTTLLPILAHEGEHVRRRHLLHDIVDKFHIALGWYNPLTYLLFKKGVELREFECDRIVAARFSPEKYGRILIDEAESLSRIGKWALSSAFINPSLFKRRFQMLFERNPGKRGKLIVAVSIVGLLCTGLLITTFSAQNEKKWTPKIVTLPGYTPRPGYMLIKEKGEGKMTMAECRVDWEKYSRDWHDPRLKLDLAGRKQEDVDKVWRDGMNDALKINMSFYPRDFDANINRMGHMIVGLTIQPDGRVSKVDMLSSSENPGFDEAIRKQQMAVNFGLNPKREVSFVEYGFAFSMDYITYPPKK